MENNVGNVVVPKDGKLDMEENNKVIVVVPSNQSGTTANLIVHGNAKYKSSGGMNWIGPPPSAGVLQELRELPKAEQKTAAEADKEVIEGFYITVKGKVLERREGGDTRQVKSMKVKSTDAIGYVIKQLQVPVSLVLKNEEGKELNPSHTLHEAGVIDGSVLFAVESVVCVSSGDSTGVTVA